MEKPIPRFLLLILKNASSSLLTDSIRSLVIKEIIIYENGKYYDIISYEKGQEKLSYYQKLYGKSNDKKYFKYLLHKETYIFKKSKNFKTLKNIIYLFLKTI